MLLGDVAGDIGAGESVVGAAVVGSRQKRRSDAHANAETQFAELKFERAHDVVQVAGERVDPGFRGIRQEAGEFVTAEARKRRAFRQGSLDRLRQLAQHVVAGQMPAGIVDQLELIEIQVQHCMVPVGVVQRGVDAIIEFVAVYQAGQDVVARAVIHL